MGTSTATGARFGKVSADLINPHEGICVGVRMKVQLRAAFDGRPQFILGFFAVILKMNFSEANIQSWGWCGIMPFVKCELSIIDECFKVRVFELNSASGAGECVL